MPIIPRVNWIVAKNVLSLDLKACKLQGNLDNCVRGITVRHTLLWPPNKVFLQIVR